ncbi:MAG: VOC family protein [Usitatibacter sp.]
MVLELDHLVIAAATLEEGVRYVEAQLGVTMGPGGKHATMGTHNRLLSLGRGCAAGEPLHPRAPGIAPRGIVGLGE